MEKSGFVQRNAVTYMYVPATRIKLGNRSFPVAAPETWNSLPLRLHLPTISQEQFQVGLKTTC